MAYTKTNWVNGYTPLNASNMNKIEEGIFNNDTFLSSLDIRVEDLENSIGQGGIGSVVVNGNGNALTNASYNPSTKILNFEKNNTFALDSDSKKSLYHLGAYDSISGNVITRQTGYLSFNVNDTKNWIKETFTTIVRYHTNFEVNNNIVSNIPIGSDIGDTSPTNNGWFYTNNTIYVYAKNNDFSNIKNGLFQYKLATPYTEEIIEGQPLTTLDQSGSQWVREEWEKGLNLYYKNDYSFSAYGQSLVARGSYITLNGTNTKGSDNFLPFNPFNDLEVNKVYTLKLSTTTGFILECWINGIQYKTDTNGLITINLTQDIKNGDWRIVAGSNSSFNNTLINIMLVKGSHAYSYHVYQGGIAREDQLVQRKLFSARDSTMDDVKSFVNNNHYRIISIMYFADSERYSKGRSVIYNADEGSYFYINSDHTFSDVQLNSNATQNRYDYIYIHYHKY